MHPTAPRPAHVVLQMGDRGKNRGIFPGRTIPGYGPRSSILLIAWEFFRAGVFLGVFCWGLVFFSFQNLPPGEIRGTPSVIDNPLILLHNTYIMGLSIDGHPPGGECQGGGVR